MPRKQHLRLISKKQLETISKMKFNYGLPDEDSQRAENPNYYRMAERLSGNWSQYNLDLQIRKQNRSSDIFVPENIEYIMITFMGQFDLSKYNSFWYNNFGLQTVTVSDFGHKVLFAVSNYDLFKEFTSNLLAFIDYGINNNKNASFLPHITYIQNFKLLTSSDIIQFPSDQIGDVVILSLIDLPLDYRLQSSLLESLKTFLNQSNVSFKINEESGDIELYNPSFEIVKSIADNFDILQSITSSLTTTISPSPFNVPERVHGFEIENSKEDLPLIGIIDTGISDQSPLKSITLKDDSFSLDGNPLIDNAGNNGEGHGTAVAAFAALGREAWESEFSSPVIADAKLLSIKIYDSGEGYISTKALIEMLYRAKAKYPELRIFVLTSCFQKNLNTNEPYSHYSFLLDKFAWETDSLIFIATGNNDAASDDNQHYDFKYFEKQRSNICSPAESMNNLVVGAAAGNLKNDSFLGISPSREFPALFTRKGHIDLKPLYPKNKSNKNLFRPDVIEYGGDIENYNNVFLAVGEKASLKLMSSNPQEGYYSNVGTSFSTPLTANLAAKILNQYPTIKSQTIKALIVNGASLENIKPQSSSNLLSRVAGHGLVNIENTIYSDDSRLTFILEDQISHNELKIYPINFPEYLIRDNLGKKNGVLKVSATLCFSFLPILNNQLSYNPVHMAFSFFKNHTDEQIMASDEKCSSLLKNNLRWSQNGRHKAKPIPYSNTQKISFPVNVNDLVNEESTFKLAIHSRMTTQLIDGLNYPEEFPFSMAVTIEEKLKEPTGRLYEELTNRNYLDNILESDIDLNQENDLEIQ